MEISTHQNAYGYLLSDGQKITQQDRTILKHAAGIVAVILERNSLPGLLAGKLTESDWMTDCTSCKNPIHALTCCGWYDRFWMKRPD